MTKKEILDLKKKIVSYCDANRGKIDYLMIYDMIIDAKNEGLEASFMAFADCYDQEGNLVSNTVSKASVIRIFNNYRDFC